MPPTMGPMFFWGMLQVWKAQGNKRRPSLGGVGGGKGFLVGVTS